MIYGLLYKLSQYQRGYLTLRPAQVNNEHRDFAIAVLFRISQVIQVLIFALITSTRPAKISREFHFGFLSVIVGLTCCDWSLFAGRILLYGMSRNTILLILPVAGTRLLP